MNTQPLLIEFSGIHNSGKTTIIEKVVKALQDDGLKVYTLFEALEFEPCESYEKVSTAISNRQKLFKNLLTLQNYDVVIFDNCGYCKSLVDLDCFEELIDSEEIMTKFKNLQDNFSTSKMTDIYYFDIEVTPEEAIKRETDSLVTLSLSDLQKKAASYSKIFNFIQNNLKNKIWILKNSYFNEECAAVLSATKIKNILEIRARNHVN